MPDYSIIEQFCKELSVTLSELMDGEDAAKLLGWYIVIICHADPTGFYVLSVVIFSIHCRQPNNSGTHFKCILY